MKYIGGYKSASRRHETFPTRDDDNVIRRLAESAYDDEPITPEEITAIEEGIADIKAGRVRSLPDVMKDLGDDKIIKSRTS
ncbi:hypothetical protein [Methanoregula sp. UBA64]|uniref:hypothetical protein n=1 Tax=Methanoregula sp. UBA64 TaxID=1915554 RepID=UPI0025D57B1D|nr:hypothetical protein [Methanoregula sp. UBA64]